MVQSRVNLSRIDPVFATQEVIHLTRRIRGDVLGAVLAAELRRLEPTFGPGFFQDWWDLGVGDEALPALLIPVEDCPDPVVLIGIAKDEHTLGPVLLSLLSALG